MTDIMFFTSESWKSGLEIKKGKLKTLILSLSDITSILNDVLEDYSLLEQEIASIKSLKRKTCQSCGGLQTEASELSNIDIIHNYKSIEEIILKKTNKLTPEEISKNVINSISLKNNNNIEKYILDEISMSDIEGTPNGRKSPILNCKKPIKRAKKLSQTDSEEKGLTGCCTTPQSKVVKLSQTAPSSGTKPKSRLKQLRLSLSKPKEVSIIDISSQNLLKSIKREEIEDIEPSPTSSIKPEFSALYKSFGGRKKSSPTKFKKPVMPKLPLRDENQELNEDSFNLLQPLSEATITKGDVRNTDALTSDDTLCEDVTMVILDRVKTSPSKVPLTENKNVINVTTKHGADSLSVLPKKINKAEKYEPIYKEPTVRKKAEKLALPGWSCNQCENFYGVLYRDNPSMLSKLMSECSRHRSRHHPAPCTPPGYWNPRWSVASDTETFNRQNNV